MRRLISCLVLLAVIATCPAQKPDAWMDELPTDVRQSVLASQKEAGELEKLDNIDFHKAANKFALTSTSEWGLGMSTPDARKFADGLSDLPAAARAQRLAALRLGYRYALTSTSEWGLGLSTPDAFKRADTWTKATDPSRAVALHRVAYRYGLIASGEWGLGLSSPDAANFAEKIVALPDALKSLALHKKAYKYALTSISENGLGLSSSDARTFADKQAGLTKK